MLRHRAHGLRRLGRAGQYCYLDCFVTTSGTASITVPVRLQRALAELRLELKLSFWAGEPANERAS